MRPSQDGSAFQCLASQSPRVTYYLPHRSYQPRYLPPLHRTPRSHTRKHPRSPVWASNPVGWLLPMFTTESRLRRVTAPSHRQGHRVDRASHPSALSLQWVAPERSVHAGFSLPVCACPTWMPSFTSLRVSTRRGRRFPSLRVPAQSGRCVFCPTPSRLSMGSVRRTLCVHIQHSYDLVLLLSCKGAEIELIVKQAGEVEYCICNNSVLCIHKTRRSLYIYGYK